MAGGEKRLTIRSKGGRVLSVEANDKALSRVVSVSFTADANEPFITASLTLGVDVVDLIDTADALSE